MPDVLQGKYTVDLLQQLKNISKKSEEPAELETSVLQCYILTIKTLQKNRKGLNEEIIQYCKNSEKPICLNSFNTLLMFIF